MIEFLLLSGHRCDEAVRLALLHLCLLQLDLQSAQIAVNRTVDIVLHCGESLVDLSYYRVGSARRCSNLLIAQTFLVVVTNLLLHSHIGNTGVGRDKFVALHLRHIVLDVVSKHKLHLHLGYGIFIACSISDKYTGSRLNVGDIVANLERLNLGVDAAKVVRESRDTIHDESLGAESHAVLVVDNVLVVGSNQAVKNVLNHREVLTFESEAEYRSLFIGLLHLKFLAKSKRQLVCIAHAHNHLLSHRTGIELCSF